MTNEIQAICKTFKIPANTMWAMVDISSAPSAHMIETIGRTKMVPAAAIEALKGVMLKKADWTTSGLVGLN